MVLIHAPLQVLVGKIDRVLGAPKEVKNVTSLESAAKTEIPLAPQPAANEESD